MLGNYKDISGLVQNIFGTFIPLYLSHYSLSSNSQISPYLALIMLRILLTRVQEHKNL